MRKKNHLKDNT